MIVKHILNPKSKSTKAARIGSLLDYIATDDRRRGEKVQHVGVEGDFLSTSMQGQRAEMIALATEATRSKDPVDHWLVSWKEGEQPTEAQCDSAVAILKKHLGMSPEHLTIYALHKNTDNYHLHVVLNRVHPATMLVQDKGWAIDRAHQAVAEMVNAQGWEPEKNARYIVDASGKIVRRTQSPMQQPRTKARDYENATGEKSCERIAIEKACPILANAKTWLEIHREMAASGMRYEPKGSGAIVWVGQQPVKASVIGREYSRKRMEERLGTFQPDVSAPRIGLSTGELEPIHPAMPKGWEEYRETIVLHRTQRDSALTAQRTQHRVARLMLFEAFKKERNELYEGGNWSGNALNVARSLLAGEQAKRKAQLLEQQKQERNLLRKSLGTRMTFEQFLIAQSKDDARNEWRYRNTAEQVASIHGERNVPLEKHDIRDFEAQVQLSDDGRPRAVHYRSRFAPKRVSFTDLGKRIDIHQFSDEASVLASLQLGAQKWGTLTVNGPPEFKHLCATIAARHGIKISNPELQIQVSQTVFGTSSTTATPKELSPALAYARHKADVLAHLKVRNGSQLDWMIAVRMRVTGHDQQSIAQALLGNASTGRESENRDWSNYAARTAKAAFGPRGDRECDRCKPRALFWARMEGRNVPLGHGDQMAQHKIVQGDRHKSRGMEIGD